MGGDTPDIALGGGVLVVPCSSSSAPRQIVVWGEACEAGCLIATPSLMLPIVYKHLDLAMHIRWMVLLVSRERSFRVRCMGFYPPPPLP